MTIIPVCNYTVSQKRPTFALLELWHTWTHFDIFSRNVIHKVSNQKTLYYATSNNVCFCTTWQNGETRKSQFFTQMLYQCIARIQPVAPWFLQSFWLTTHMPTHVAVWLLNLVVSAFSLGCWRAWFKRKEVESAAAVGLCCTHNACAPMRCLPERKKCHLWCVW